MIERRFSAWCPWSQRGDLPRTGCPGVYAIARTSANLTGRAFRLREDIIYFGMTNAAYGLRGRLDQFDNTISGKRLAHGGADRVRHRYMSYSRLAPKLYVSIARFACDPTSNLPTDLRKMGTVARFEYLCFAEFAERFGRLPPFNDKGELAKVQQTGRHMTANPAVNTDAPPAALRVRSRVAGYLARPSSTRIDARVGYWSPLHAVGSAADVPSRQHH